MTATDAATLPVVLVTGASRGIGRQTALAFARLGWKVVCQYRSSRDLAERTAAEVERLGGQCLLVQADFSDQESVQDFLSKIEGMRLTTLVNNAGAYVHAVEASKLTLRHLTETFLLNAFAPMLIAVRAFEGMARRGVGRIVNVSSVAAKYGGSWRSMDYGCSKRALEGATRTLAREGANTGVLVNTVRPGVIETDFHQCSGKDLPLRAAMIPMKRLGQPEEAARAIFFLGSLENTYITGQTLSVSGGE